MQLASKSIQEKKISNLKKKQANKKPNSQKKIESSHWNSDVRKTIEEKKAQINQAKKEKAKEKS